MWPKSVRTQHWGSLVPSLSAPHLKRGKAGYEASTGDLTDIDTLGKSLANQLTPPQAHDFPRMSMSVRSLLLCSNLY